jgi:drug/metabolite transporter (DMT)-like permease
MNKQELRSNILLMITAVIFGFAFIVQRVGARYVGAFTFNGIQFALGSITLVPLLLYFTPKYEEEKTANHSISSIPGGVITGSILFLAASFQQIGLADTTAGKAAFITGLYIVLVHLIGVLLKHRIYVTVWIGTALAIIGLYFLCVTASFTISKGDFLELIGAVFWACHIVSIDHFNKKVDVLKLSFVQFITCSFLSLVVAIILEKITLYSLTQALVPLLYGGIVYVGIACTFQVIGQKNTKASQAAIILSMESVFAAIGGLLLLNEVMGIRGYAGCILMIIGMLLSQKENIEIKNFYKNS